MDRNSDVLNNKIKLIAIGAGALVLALIAFSGLGWCAIIACGHRMASISVGYWELLGGTSAAVLAVLFIRPLRNRFLPRQLRSAPDLLPAAVLPAAVFPPAEEPVISPQIPSPAIPSPEEEAAEETKDSNWRQLYSQLSTDEREMFKSIMKKYCADAPEERTAAEPE